MSKLTVLIRKTKWIVRHDNFKRIFQRRLRGNETIPPHFRSSDCWELTQLTFTCLKSTIETLEKMCDICSKLTTKTPELRQWRRSDVFFVNYFRVICCYANILFKSSIVFLMGKTRPWYYLKISCKYLLVQSQQLKH